MISITTRKSTHDLVKNNIKSIATQSTIHGLPSMLNTNYTLMQSLWLVVFLLAIGYSSFLIVQSFMNYTNYDVLIVMDYEADYNLDFPALAICDLAAMNRTLDDILITCEFNAKPCNMSYFGKVFEMREFLVFIFLFVITS